MLFTHVFLKDMILIAIFTETCMRAIKGVLIVMVCVYA